MNFRTFARTTEIEGIGLHTGDPVRLRLCPAEAEGICFVRTDLPDTPVVKAEWCNVTSTTHATTLEDGAARVMTTEHLLASLWAAGVTHCRIELDAPEVPILDGSARGWVEAVARAGTRDLNQVRPVLELRAPVWIEEGRASVLGVPSRDFRLTVAVDFDAPHAGAQLFDGIVSPELFATEIAGARTFTLESWIEPLRAANLIRGGSLENAILIGAEGPSSPFRFENELARHKALDVIGDLALLFGAHDFRGHIIATRAGHGAHRRWMQACRTADVLRCIS